MGKNRLLYLSYQDVVDVDLTMPEIIESMEKMFQAKGQGRTEMPPKPGIHPGAGDNFIHAMPASIPDLNSAGIKWVSGFPENPAKGLPYISGLLIFNDVQTGLPLSVMDGVWMTAKRTGAASVISARYLARPESSVMGMLGCGVQGRSHVEALKVLFPLEKVMAYDASEDARNQYAEEIGAKFELEVVPVQTPQGAVTGCDIVVTAGPMVDEGAFASLVDYDSYWQPAAMQETDIFCTDDTNQFRAVQQAGYFKGIPDLQADLGELVTGQKPGRQTPAQRTMTANLGLALDDMAVAPLIYQKAKEKGIGTWLPL